MTTWVAWGKKTDPELATKLHERHEKENGVSISLSPPTPFVFFCEIAWLDSCEVHAKERRRSAVNISTENQDRE